MYRPLHIRYEFGCDTYMHQSLTISMLSSLRRNITWMSSKSNMISVIPTVRNLKIFGEYRALMLVSWSLHALLYQVCILFIKPGHPSNKEWGRKSLPYLNFFGQSGKSAMSSTPIFLMKSWSVRGTETPGRLVALESKTSFDFVPYPMTFPLTSAWCLWRVIYLQYLRPPSGMTI